MDEIAFLSSPPTATGSSSSVNKSNSVPSSNSLNCQRQRIDSATVIQQSDVSSSRPALLAQDALGPLIFEALDGFFFIVNHNFELDFVSDNVGQYLNLTQDELTGRNLHFCVHPSDVGEFSKAWAKIDAGDSLDSIVNGENSRGVSFHCRMRTNDEVTHYVNMLVSAGLHRDTSGSDKTFLVCVARRTPVEQFKSNPAVLGFDQFSSRINLQYEIESFDGSHIKSERLDLNFRGKYFRDYVHPNDVALVHRHFQEVVEKGETISPVYRFCLHNEVFAFVSSHSKLFSGSLNGTPDSIMSTHTIIRLIENKNEITGNASTRLMKSIIGSNRDLQRNKSISSRPQSTSQPIGTQFALTMLGINKNSSSSIQQHVSATLGTLVNVQNAFPTTSPTRNEKSNSTSLVNSICSSATSKSSMIDSVSSSETTEFGNKQRNSLSPSLGSVPSNYGSLSSPNNGLDLFQPCFSPNNDLTSFLPSPLTKEKKFSPNSRTENNVQENYQNENCSNPISNNQSRSSLRLRQLLSNKSPPSTMVNSPQMIQTPQDIKMSSTSFDDPNQFDESPTTTNISPISSVELCSPSGHRTKINSNAPLGDALLKQILGRQTPNNSTINDGNAENSSSNGSTSLKNENQTNEEQTIPASLDGAANKLRSDTFLRTLLNDEIRQQKVLVEAPFTYGSRNKVNQRGSAGSVQLVATNSNNSSRSNSKNQNSLGIDESAIWDKSTSKKKQRQNSHTYGCRNTVGSSKKTTRNEKQNTSDYLIFNPQNSLSENSLDSFLDGNPTGDLSTSQSSPIVLSHRSTSNNLKRSADQEDSTQNSRKFPKLLTRALKDDIKIESADSSIISPSIAMAATRPLHSSTQISIKNEPDIFELNSATKRPNVLSSSNSGQTSLLRTLIRTPQPSLLTPKKDAPLYDLLQTIDSAENIVYPNVTNVSSSKSNRQQKNSLKTSNVDPLEQYLTNSGNKNSTSTRDEYLAALLSTDPQQPSEISFIPANRRNDPTNLVSSSTTSTENRQNGPVADDSFDASSVSAAQQNAMSNNKDVINDDFLYLLDNRDFLECLNDSSAIDSILSDAPSNFPQTCSRSTVLKHTEKDEKAISEIYKNLVTSFTPGPNPLDSSVDNSPFNSLPGDFLLTENNNNSGPTNRTVNIDPMMNNFRQQNNNFNYQNTQSQSMSSNTSQYSDCLPLDMIDSVNGYPPNVTLNQMSNSSYLPTNNNSNMENNSMMLYSQQNSNQATNQFYRQPSQTHQQTNLYNNFASPPPNQVAPNYYPTQQQISPISHNSSMNKRSALMHGQRTAQQNNQQFQLQMSMNMQPNNQQQQQQQQRPMIEPFNDVLLPNGGSSGLQQDFHSYNAMQRPSNNSLDLPFNNHDLLMSSSPTGLNVQQQQSSTMMHSRNNNLPPSAMHQTYSNMNRTMSTSIQQPSSHNSNNSSMANPNSIECRQSDEVNNQMMNCLSFQPARSTSEFVRKQLQHTIQGRQKPAGGKDLPLGVPVQKLINSSNLDPNQKGAYFRSQLSSSLGNPSLQTNSLRPPTHPHNPHH